MMAIKDFLRDWLPPIVARNLPRSRKNEIFFAGPFPGWQEARGKSTGYDSESILQSVLRATMAVKRGEAAFERDSVLFAEFEYEWPVAAGLLWGAACGRGRLDVLDFGGALGSTYFQYARILTSLPRCSWSVVEQSHYVDAGREFVQDDCLRFYKTIDELPAERKPNVILLSSVLQYIEYPESVIEELLSLNAEIIIVDRTIVNESTEDRVYIQHVPEHIYSAQYPCRSFSAKGLAGMFLPCYELHSSFRGAHSPKLGSIDSKLEGFLFRKHLEP